MDEAEPHSEPYPSFDAFFTRRLRAGARPVAVDTVVSPCDGQLLARGPIVSDGTMLVKGRRYSIGELTMASEATLQRFKNGSFAVIYLAPHDYHRVHSPVDGEVVSIRGIPGDYFPVNQIGERHIPRLLVRNNRVSISVESPAHGLVNVVLVGAYIVGRISVAAIPGPAVAEGEHVLSPAQPIRKGDELGAFHLGSTVVVLVERDGMVKRPLGPVRYGEALLSEVRP